MPRMRASGTAKTLRRPHVARVRCVAAPPQPSIVGQSCLAQPIEQMLGVRCTPKGREVLCDALDGVVGQDLQDRGSFLTCACELSELAIGCGKPLAKMPVLRRPPRSLC